MWTGTPWELTLSPEALSCVNRYTVGTDFIPWSAVLCEQVHHGNWLSPLKGCPVWTGTPWELTLSLKRCPVCTGESWELTLSTEGLSCVNKCTMETQLYPLKGCPVWTGTPWELTLSLKRCPMCTGASWELTLSTEGLSCVNRCTVVTNFVPWRTVLCELVHRWNWLYPLKCCPVCSSFCFSLRDSSPFHRDWDQHFPTPSSPWCGRFELLLPFSFSVTSDHSCFAVRHMDVYSKGNHSKAPAHTCHFSSDHFPWSSTFKRAAILNPLQVLSNGSLSPTLVSWCSLEQFYLFL